ncbi:hypothetical protein Tco_0322815 [Tanacetum coccineum]
MVHSMFNSRESDVDDNPVNDRFKICEGFHAVPPPYTGNYMPPRPDLSFAGLDESVFKFVVRKTTTSVPETDTSISKTSKGIVEKPKFVRPSAYIIEEWDTNNDNDSVFRLKSDQTKPKFTKVNFVKSGENVKSVNKENTHTQVEYPWKSQSPRAVATKSGQVQVNAAKQSSQTATSISTARPVNTDAPKPKVNNVTTAGPKAVVSATAGNGENVVKSSACWIWRPIGNVIDHNSKDSGSYMLKRFNYGNPQYTLQDQGIFDSGCSRHMTGNKCKYIAKELKFNLFRCLNKCEQEKLVLFTETKYLVLSPDFKLLDESQVLLKVPRQNNMYSFDLKNVVPSGDLFGRPVTILNTLDPLGKFDGKANEGFLVGYSINSKAFRPVTAGNQTNVMQSSEDAVADDAGKKTTKEPANKGERNGQEKEGGASNKEGDQNSIVSAVGQSFINVNDLPTDPLMPDLEDTTDLLNTGIFSGAYDDEDVGAKADLNNLEITMNVKQKDDGIFINQDKYMADILKKFDFVIVKTTSTPIDTNKALLKDKEAKDVYIHLYRSMIRSFIEEDLRYLKGQPKLGLWYLRDSPFDFEAFSDSDYVGASLDRKSTIGGCQFLGKRTEGNADFHQIVDFLNASTIRYSLTISPTIYASYIEQFWSTAKTKIVNNETQIYAKVDGKTIVISESSVRIVEDEGSRQAYEPQPTPSPTPPSHEVQVTTVASHPQKTHTPRRAKKGRDTEIPQLVMRLFETASKQSHDPPLSKVNTSGSGEDSMEHQDDLTDFIPPTPHDSPLLGGFLPWNIKDCSRIVWINKKKERQKIGKEQRSNSRGETLQDWYLQEKEFG